MTEATPQHLDRRPLLIGPRLIRETATQVCHLTRIPIDISDWLAIDPVRDLLAVCDHHTPDQALRYGIDDRVVLILGRRSAHALSVDALHYYDWQHGEDAVPARAVVVLPDPVGQLTEADRAAYRRAFRKATRLARPAAPGLGPLTPEEQQVIAELAATSSGSISGYAPVGTKSGFTGSTPTGTSAYPHEEHVRALLAAPTHDDRTRALDHARRELQRIRQRPADAPAGIPETERQLCMRLVDRAAGIPAHEVLWTGEFRDLTVRRVRQLRELHGTLRKDREKGDFLPAVDPELGLPVADQADIHDLVEKGGQRHAARVLGVSETTIRRRLKRAA